MSLKAPSVSRKILEASGLSGLLVRDYMEKGRGSKDTTVLPRFWLVNANDLHKMRIAVQGTPGFAGIIVTHRGLAVRVWSDQIKEARQALMAADNRLVPETMHVIPKVCLELDGPRPLMLQMSCSLQLLPLASQSFQCVHIVKLECIRGSSLHKSFPKRLASHLRTVSWLKSLRKKLRRSSQ